MSSDRMRWIRPLVIVLLVMAVVTGFFIGKIIAEAFVPFATGLVVYWFKSRDDSKKG